MWTAWDELMQSATEFRHALHQRPELPWQEEQTARSIRQELDRAGIRWRSCAGTGRRFWRVPRSRGAGWPAGCPCWRAI